MMPGQQLNQLNSKLTVLLKEGGFIKKALEICSNVLNSLMLLFSLLRSSSNPATDVWPRGDERRPVRSSGLHCH